MGELFEGWTSYLEDAHLLLTPDEPEWVRPKYMARTEEDEPIRTEEEEFDLMSQQIEASEFQVKKEKGKVKRKLGFVCLAAIVAVLPCLAAVAALPRSRRRVGCPLVSPRLASPRLPSSPLEGYVDNDAVIAQFYQDELSRVAQAEASGLNNPSRTLVVAQEWPHPLQGKENQGKTIDISRESDIHHKHCGDMEDKNVARIGIQGGQSSPSGDDDSDCSVEIKEESSLDYEVGKRLNQMIPVALSTSSF